MSHHSHSGSSRAGSPCSVSSTAPSSLCSQLDEEDHIEDLQRQTFDVVRTLLKEKRETECVIAAWRVRCETLEAEVERLAGLMGEMEAKEQARKKLAAWGSPISVPPSPPVSPPASAVCEEETNSLPDVTTRTCTDWRAACQKNQPIPVVDPSKSMSKQNPPPCNSYYLCGSCSVPRCKFSHLYQLTAPQIEEMRRGAKFHQCNAIKNGAICTDPTCCYGHVCPRGSSCGRTNCAFNDEQHKGPPTVRPLLRRA